jgi:hypothetical protein
VSLKEDCEVEVSGGEICWSTMQASAFSLASLQAHSLAADHVSLMGKNKSSDKEEELLVDTLTDCRLVISNYIF